MLKYENLTFKNIYFRTIKQYTEVDPTVDFVFPVNKIDRENNDKNSYHSKELNMFLLLRTTVLCTVVYRNIITKLSFILQQLFPVIQPFFFGAKIFNPQEQKSTKIKCLLFSPNRRNYRLYGIMFSRGIMNRYHV